MAKECLWYNGEFAVYELLDFDPDGLKHNEIIKKAKQCLKEKYCFNAKELDKAMETLYLIDIEHLVKLK